MSRRGALKVAFVGGGSYRILPILRAAFACRGVFDGGEVRLVDLNLARALFRKMLAIHEKYIPAQFQRARDYFSNAT
jgi:alpha-galactosidase/6-phospho-beta-glucosidase family protein